MGFPHGSTTTEAKVFETTELIALGPEKIDIVINIGRPRDGDVAYVQDEIAAVVQTAAGTPRTPPLFLIDRRGGHAKITSGGVRLSPGSP